MKLISLTFFFCLISLIKVDSQNMINTHGREVRSLNGTWKYIVDPYENGFYDYRYRPFEDRKNPGNGAFFTNAKRKNKADLIEYDFDKSGDIEVPGDWNSQDLKLFYYEGTVWYKKSFDYKKKQEDNRVFLYFGAVNYKADVYFNGKKLGRHIGGFTPFQFEVTNLLEEKENFVVVKVDNKRTKEGVPTLNTDWWNYGGITRDVKLIETAETFILDYSLQLAAADKNIIRGKIRLDGNDKAGREVQVQIPELGINYLAKTGPLGISEFELKVKDVKYWSTEMPYLYQVNLKLGANELSDKIGFRSIETKGADILLNGKSIFLKGISIHEESLAKGGRATDENDAEQLLLLAKELGCNYVRLAHYPHNEYIIKLADKMGILVWEEIPVYWTIDWQNQETYLNAQNQISEVIDRDKNRASVIIWSMANETPTSADRNAFLGRLAKFTKTKDKTRLISAALEQQDYPGLTDTRTISDPFADVVDILSFNQYIGWYDGGIGKCQRIKWKIEQDKPVIISEFGAGAKYGLHGEKDERWTEEYQAYLYEETIKMIDQIEQLRGVSPWILVDFKSPRRVLPEIQDNFNRKGLVSEKGEKKQAFFVLQKYYEMKQ